MTSGEAVKFDMIKAELMDALKASIRKQVGADASAEVDVIQAQPKRSLNTCSLFFFRGAA